MTDGELTLIREAPFLVRSFRQVRRDAGTAGCTKTLITTSRIVPYGLSKRLSRFHPCRRVRPRREGMGQVYLGPARRSLSLVEVEHVKE